MDGTNIPTNAPSSTTTVLRIKRRRTEEPIPFIRLEGVVTAEEANYYNNSSNNRRIDGSTNDGNNGSSSNTVVVWKRVREQTLTSADIEPITLDGKNTGGGYGGSGGLRVINAVLDSSSNNKDDALVDNNDYDSSDEYEHRRSNKRRRLTILDLEEDKTVITNNTKSSSPRRKKKGGGGKPIKVLDPLSRIVDDSLQEVLMGSKTIREHYQLIVTNPLLLQSPPKSSSSHSRITSGGTGSSTGRNNKCDSKNMMTTVQAWLCWVHSSGGNILHCCALWNDGAMARTILSTTSSSAGSSMEGAQQPSWSSSSSLPSTSSKNYKAFSSLFVRHITESTDSDGRTPYEVAELCGHEDVCKVLTEFGGDTSNYIYDVFHHLPLTAAASPSPSSPAKNGSIGGADTVGGGFADINKHTGAAVGKDGNESGSYHPSSATLTTAEEADEWMAMMDIMDGITTAYLTSGVGYWTPEGELVLEPDAAGDHRRRFHRGEVDDDYYEDDVDSNCEDYDANDYPEDLEEDDDHDKDDNIDGLGRNFRYSEPIEQYRNIGNTTSRPYGVGGNGNGAAFYEGGDDGYEYDWEQDLVDGGGHEREEYHYYAPDDDYDDDHAND